MRMERALTGVPFSAGIAPSFPVQTAPSLPGSLAGVPPRRFGKSPVQRRRCGFARKVNGNERNRLLAGRDELPRQPNLANRGACRRACLRCIRAIGLGPSYRPDGRDARACCRFRAAGTQLDVRRDCRAGTARPGRSRPDPSRSDPFAPRAKRAFATRFGYRSAGGASPCAASPCVGSPCVIWPRVVYCRSGERHAAVG